MPIQGHRSWGNMSSVFTYGFPTFILLLFFTLALKKTVYSDITFLIVTTALIIVALSVSLVMDKKKHSLAHRNNPVCRLDNTSVFSFPTTLPVR